MLNQEANSSANLPKHEDEHGRQNAPQLSLVHSHSTMLPQARSAARFLQTVIKYPRRFSLVSFASWVSPENVSGLEGKCHGKQDTGQPQKMILAVVSLQMTFCHQAGGLSLANLDAWPPSRNATSEKAFPFLKNIYLFIFERGEGREKERERNISVWLPLTWPQLGTWPSTQACTLMGNQTSDLSVFGLVL